MSMKLTSSGIQFSVPLVGNLPTVNLEDGLVCIVTDENRGGVFVYDSTQALINNGGTVFNGWVRQYDGVINVKWFGAKGDGVTDDTIAIQSTLNIGGEIFFPEGIFYTNQINVQSDTIITFNQNTILHANTGYAYTESLLHIDGKQNIVINGNYGLVKMIKAEYTTGEFRHCVRIYGSKNITINQLNTSDSGGDGFSIGGNTVCENIDILGCSGDNHKRQGLSVTNATGLRVIGGIYENTSGTTPARGIDIESNPLEGYYLQNIVIDSVLTRNNDGGGILVSPAGKAGITNPVSITVSNCTSINDGVLGSGSFSAVPGIDMTQKMLGTVLFTDCIAIEPASCGFYINRWNDYCPKLIINNLTIYNAANNFTYPSVQFSSGLLFRTELIAATGNYYGNIEVNDLYVCDDRDIALTYVPIYFDNANYLTESFKDLTFNNLKVSLKAANWGYGGTLPLLASAPLMEDVVFNHNQPFEFPAVNGTISKHSIGLTHVATTSVTLTLPVASELIGSSYSFRNDANTNLYILPNGTDLISGYSAYAGAGIISRRAGSLITLTALKAGVWVATSCSGNWATHNLTPPRYPNSKASAIPTTGTWEVGDILYHITPVASGFIGWVCVTAGTPGVWKTFGAITA